MFLEMFFFFFFLEEFVLGPTVPSPLVFSAFGQGAEITSLSARVEAWSCVVFAWKLLFVFLSINERNLLVMAKFALTVFLAILLQVISVLGVYTEDKCIKGELHKASPSPETAEFKTCHAFKESSCCTADFTVELMANETRNLYNHSWHRCGQLSKKCQQFWVTQVA